MEKRSCSAATCNIRLASLRSFLKYLGSKEASYLELSHKASLIKRRKELKKKISSLTKEAMRVFLATPDTETRTGGRDAVLFITMYSIAARIDEILSMKVEQLHLDSKKPNITVIGKGSKIWSLYLPPKTVSHLKAYIRNSTGFLQTLMRIYSTPETAENL
jgi:site-specific recombinase XerD